MCTVLDALLADALEPIPLEDARALAPTHACPLSLQWLWLRGTRKMRFFGVAAILRDVATLDGPCTRWSECLRARP
jgi:hypothetical protein